MRTNALSTAVNSSKTQDLTVDQLKEMLGDMNRLNARANDEGKLGTKLSSWLTKGATTDAADARNKELASLNALATKVFSKQKPTAADLHAVERGIRSARKTLNEVASERGEVIQTVAETGTAAVVAGATVATGGLAAVAIGAGAGAATRVGIDATLEGAGYSPQQGVQDALVGGVQGAASSIGGGAAKGWSAAAGRQVATVAGRRAGNIVAGSLMGAAGGAISGAVGSGGTAAVQAKTWSQGAASGAATVAKSAVSGAASGAVGGALFGGVAGAAGAQFMRTELPGVDAKLKQSVWTLEEFGQKLGDERAQLLARQPGATTAQLDAAMEGTIDALPQAERTALADAVSSLGGDNMKTVINLRMSNPGLSARIDAGLIPANKVFSLEDEVTKGEVARSVLAARRDVRSSAIAELTGIKPGAPRFERIPLPDQLDAKLREPVWSLEELGQQIGRERDRLVSQGAGTHEVTDGLKRFILGLPDGGKAAEAALLEVGTDPVVLQMQQKDASFAQALHDATQVLYARHSG
jgi:hypothetical protein